MKNLLKLFSLLMIIIILSACNIEAKNNSLETSSTVKADKIEIINFHSTYQCYSCVYIGNIMFKIIDKRFKEEYQAGKITFQKINVDLPENKEISTKYQARGSSLFFNIIINNQDNISEDINIWRLIGNDQAFENYIIKKINEYLE